MCSWRDIIVRCCRCGRCDSLLVCDPVLLARLSLCLHSSLSSVARDGFFGAWRILRVIILGPLKRTLSLSAKRGGRRRGGRKQRRTAPVNLSGRERRGRRRGAERKQQNKKIGQGSGMQRDEQIFTQEIHCCFICASCVCCCLSSLFSLLLFFFSIFLLIFLQFECRFAPREMRIRIIHTESEMITTK